MAEEARLRELERKVSFAGTLGCDVPYEAGPDRLSVVESKLADLEARIVKMETRSKPGPKPKGSD